MNNNRVALYLIAVTLSMLMLAYASVPLYSLFCKATGYGGTTKASFILSNRKSEREMLVNFDANVMPDLDWKFYPKQANVKVKLGENSVVFYYAENLTLNDIVGTAVYNVTPNKAGEYFTKIQCFCFEEQLLKAGEKVLMPVSFYIDPKLEQDRELDQTKEITLSYSFYKIKEIKHNK